LIIVCIALGTVVIGGGVLVLMWLAAIGSAMGGDAECIPKTLPDGALLENGRCVHGRLIPQVPSVDAAQ
jgi:hypothetical protein